MVGAKFGAVCNSRLGEVDLSDKSGGGKGYVQWVTGNCQEAYGLLAANGILHNHESERWGETFVTRKITRAVVAIAAGRQDLLVLGNLGAKRDCEYAPDFVEGMWLMLQQDTPGDYVVATGERHTVRVFAVRALSQVGLGRARFVRIVSAYYRQTEVEHLHGNATRANAELGWQPTVLFPELLVRMVDHDLSVRELTFDEPRACVTERFNDDLRIEPDTHAELHPEDGPQSPVVTPEESKDA